MKKRLCAQCGAELVPDEYAGMPGVSPCGDCGAQRRAAAMEHAPMAAPPPRQDDPGIPPEAEVFIRRMQSGPFVFRQFSTTTTRGGGPGCGCGCLIVILTLYLMVRGFLSLF